MGSITILYLLSLSFDKVIIVFTPFLFGIMIYNNNW
jgi:hypothetical protein